MTNQSDSVLYAGVTNDLQCRVAQHRGGENPGFTAQYRCHKLVYYEHRRNALDAIAREKRIKNWSRARKNETYRQAESTCIDLAEDIV